MIDMSETPNKLQLDDIDRQDLPDQIRYGILSLIQERRLRPGDKLPPERQLAKMLGVSRPSVRQALGALSAMNVIEVRQGSGTYVSSLDPALLVQHLDFVFSLGDSDFLQLLEARRIVEPGIAALAADRISDEQIARLEELMETAAESVERHEKFLEADIDIHATITAAAGNEVLRRMVGAISQLSRASRLRTTEIPGVPQQVLEDHRVIVCALKSRDGEGARKAMMQHLSDVEESLRAVVEKTS
jgi:DNA-binding FadR family transcriptional regulator